MTREEAIRNYIENLSKGELVELMQHMNGYDNCFDYFTYYDMAEFDEFLDGYTPMEIARMIHFGEFNPYDDYFRFDGYGNLESLDWQEICAEAKDSKDDIIDHLVNYYSGDTPWAELDYLVDSDNDALFNDDLEEVEEEEEG